MPNPKPTISLTPRETDIARLLWNGLTNQQMSVKLGISRKTVEAHRSAMLRKYRINNAALLLKELLRDGVVKL